ncbi:ATP-dependent DNA helicase PIF1-like protein [Tanacetum coccineum]
MSFQSSTFLCEVKIDKVRTKKGWNYPSCGGEKCKKGNLDRKEGRFWCDSCNNLVEYPVIRYRLEMEISDDTAEVVVVMFDETTTSLLKCFASSILDSEERVSFLAPYNLTNTFTELRLQDEEEHLGLPPALANIVGTRHTLELKSHTYYEHGTYESFTCWKVVTGEDVEEGASSGMVAANDASKAPVLKRLNKNPSMATHLKSGKEKKQRIDELEDSDTEGSFIADSQPKGGYVACSFDTRKRKSIQVFFSVMPPGYNHTDRPSLSDILHTSVMIYSNIIIRRDGTVQSFCGLKLSDIALGTSSMPAKGDTGLKRKPIVDTPNRPFPQAAPRTTGQKQAAKKARKPPALSPAWAEVSYHNLGVPTYQCRGCNATMWYEERNNKGNRAANPTFSLCCQQGKVLLSRFNETPEPLNRLLDYSHHVTSRFGDQISVYNGMFCFTSFGARINHSINVGRGLYTFRINGQNYHRFGSLLTKDGTQPMHAQLWFFDTHNKVKNRLGAFIDKETGEGVDGTIVGSLIEMLDQNSSIAKAFRMVKDWCHSHTYVNVKLRLVFKRTNSRQYNAPTVAEVVALITNAFGDGAPIRDIVVNKKDSGPKRISELHPSYMALKYPLLFPYGEYGYHDKILYHSNTGTRKTNRGYVTLKEYYAYVIQYRKEQGTTLLRGGRLFQQYLVDAYTTIKEQRLFIEFQKLGLPHAYNLLWLKEHCKCKTLGDIDDIISAKLPSPMDDPARYKAVTDYILHGPCGKDASYVAYLKPCEAVWRILSFDIHDAYPSVMKLNLHLPNQHPVTLRDSECLPALLEREVINVTMFTDWFNLNERHPPARTLTYAEILQHYVWHEQSKIWKPRKQRKRIGRIYSTPASGD